MEGMLGKEIFGKEMEQLDLTHPAGGNIKWNNLFWKQVDHFWKSSWLNLPCEQTIPFLVICPIGMKLYVYKDTKTHNESNSVCNSQPLENYLIALRGRWTKLCTFMKASITRQWKEIKYLHKQQCACIWK